MEYHSGNSLNMIFIIRTVASGSPPGGGVPTCSFWYNSRKIYFSVKSPLSAAFFDLVRVQFSILLLSPEINLYTFIHLKFNANEKEKA